ncbi:MAG: type II toxin-antitoxin system VapC family toxin [Pseudonocardiaceae bacterium]
MDTSAWIEWLRDTGSPACRVVEQLRADPVSVAVTQPVALEVRAGTPAGALARVDRLLGAAIQLDVDPRIDFDVAAGLYRATREAGRSVRSLMDCLIAAVAVRTSAVVVHQDRDFDVLASVAADLTCIRELR